MAIYLLHQSGHYLNIRNNHKIYVLLVLSLLYHLSMLSSTSKEFTNSAIMIVLSCWATLFPLLLEVEERVSEWSIEMTSSTLC